MKKVLLITVLILATGSAFAQKRTGYIGTNAMTAVSIFDHPGIAFVTGFVIHKVGEATSMSIGIAPEVGYFVSDKLSLGLAVAFNHTSLKYNTMNTYSWGSWGINPYVRYFAISKGNFGFYLQGGVSYVFYGDDEYLYQNIDDEEYLLIKNIFYVGINPGISYKLGDSFGLTAAFGNLGYTYYGEDLSRFGLNVDMSSLRFGLFWTF